MFAGVFDPFFKIVFEEWAARTFDVVADCVCVHFILVSSMMFCR
jgi:hypothetical protein